MTSVGIAGSRSSHLSRDTRWNCAKDAFASHIGKVSKRIHSFPLAFGLHVHNTVTPAGGSMISPLECVETESRAGE